MLSYPSVHTLWRIPALRLLVYGAVVLSILATGPLIVLRDAHADTYAEEGSEIQGHHIAIEHYDQTDDHVGTERSNPLSIPVQLNLDRSRIYKFVHEPPLVRPPKI